MSKYRRGSLLPGSAERERSETGSTFALDLVRVPFAAELYRRRLLLAEGGAASLAQE